MLNCTPEGVLDDCEPVACAPPSAPPSSRLMLVQKDALIFAFGENATFKCESGDIYFEQGLNSIQFRMTQKLSWK